MSFQEELLQIFVPEKDVPAEYQLPHEINQREYLSNGEMKQWNGATHTVVSPVCFPTDNGFERKVIGSYPVCTEKEAMEALDAVKEIKQEFPYLPVLMQTVFDKDEKIFESIMAGATGYLLKKTAPEKLLEAIQDIYRGGAPMTPEIATKVLTFFRNKEDAKASAYALSDKEKRVLAYLVEGLSYKMISDKLHISYHTVNFHIRNIYHKLHVHTVSEAVAKAIKENIV